MKRFSEQDARKNKEIEHFECFNENWKCSRQSHDTQGFAPLFGMISDRIEAFLADKDYNADATRDEFASTDVEAAIPSKRNSHEPITHDEAMKSCLGFVVIAAVKLWVHFVHER
ncbi:hypothetical protein RI570_14405 [Brucella pseudogrignonensis]|uniref:hypothetical protein n=1 Tax=Brucella pseudogrignonensis TaxID=419475 RepID=UPI0028B543C7|nr:hypothetical protein [Brucella pseudogrignonensis]MDT6941312.1 hypothetical protein [Brucella pseudogrignonensis]